MRKRTRYYITKALVMVIWLAAMTGLIYHSIKDDVELRYKLVSNDFPRFLPGTPEEVSFPININTATLRELKKLDGIGDTKAGEIIAYRTENGGFQSVDELLNVKGIGKSTLEKIREFVTV